MSSRAWMPLFVGDYLSDTRHLSTLEHGAYLLLIMHYWQTGGLPDDDRQLARIAGIRSERWPKIRSQLGRFFGPGWQHKRIDAELEKAQRISESRRGAAEQMHSNRRANADVSAQGLHAHPPPPPPSKKEISEKVDGKNGWKPPRHGAVSRTKGRIYVRQGTPEWDAYAEDYRRAHGAEAVPNDYGGQWFNINGETQAQAKADTR